MQALVDAPDFGDTPTRLAELLGTAAAPDTLQPFPVPTDAAPPARVTAVDGSSATLLDARAFLVGAWRAGALTLGARGEEPRHMTPVTTRVLVKGAAADAVTQALAAAGEDGADVSPTITPDHAIDVLRSVTELVVAREAVDRLNAGDVLLVDGPLQVRPPGAPRRLVEDLLTEAAAKRVHVVGVCKSTSQTIGGFPALAVAAAAFARAGLESGRATWAAELPRPHHGTLGRVYAARLSAGEPWLFRFDVNPHDPAPVADVLGKVAALCGHPAYPGYPSPLAMVHNAVLLDEGLQREIVQTLRHSAEDAGAEPTAWDLAFGDYHDILDLGA